MSKEAMKLALEALEAMQSYAAAERKGLRICDEAITALREALAKPEVFSKQNYLNGYCVGQSDLLTEQPAQQEPVAWADECRIELVIAIHFLASDFENALGAFGGDIEARRKAEGDIAHARSVASRWNWNGASLPAQRKPLTDDEIWREYRFLWPFHPAEERKLASDILMFARAIEAAHGIKENT